MPRRTDGGVRIRLKSLFERRPRWEGGLYLPPDRQRTAHLAIEALPQPPVLRVPLAQHDGPPATPCVRPREQVPRGQRIAEARQPGSVSIHAPRAGVVAAITAVDTARGKEIPAIEIRVEESTTPEKVPSAKLSDLKSTREEWDAEALARLADNAGLVRLDGPARSLGDTIRQAAAGGVSDVIIDAMECEPMLTFRRRLLLEMLSTIIETGVFVRDVLGARHVWLAVEREDREKTAMCRTAVDGTPMRLSALPSRYPQSSPPLLTYAITGRETPCDHETIDVGVLVLDVATVTAIDAACQGRPFIERVITVTGPAAQRPGNYRLCPGTSFAHVLSAVGLRKRVAQVIDGGMMTGTAVESLDAVITARTSGIILLDDSSAVISNPGPCIRCGWCVEDCPASVDPRALYHAYETSRTDEANKMHLQACVDCGVCSFVCPVQLPLAEAIVRLRAIVEGQ